MWLCYGCKMEDGEGHGSGIGRHEDVITSRVPYVIIYINVSVDSISKGCGFVLLFVGE